MKVGIILYSLTGNTLSVAEQLQGQLAAAGHEVVMERFNALSDPTKNPRPEIDRLPDASGYDALVVAAPVHAFGLAGPMQVCLERLETGGPKPAVLLTTHQFPRPWMGASRTIQMMQDLCEKKGCRVMGSGIINWSRKDRNQQITDVVANLASLLEQSGSPAR
jgi:hypothetical protein